MQLAESADGRPRRPFNRTTIAAERVRSATTGIAHNYAVHRYVLRRAAESGQQITPVPPRPSPVFHGDGRRSSAPLPVVVVAAAVDIGLSIVFDRLRSRGVLRPKRRRGRRRVN